LFVGDSLGGVLSQYTAIATGKDAIVIDSPRVKGPYGSSKITFYNGPANIINFNIDKLSSKQSDNLELITVYKKSDLCFECRFPGSTKQHGIDNFVDAYNLDGSLKPGYTELRTKFTPNIVELYAGKAGYNEVLRSQWLNQFRQNVFDNNAF